MHTRRAVLAAVAANIGSPLLGLNLAIAEPASKVARLVVPFPAGGGTDVVARLLGQSIRNHFPRGIVIDNRPGASGRLGAELVRASDPDGSTMLIVPDFVMTIFPHIFPKLTYNPIQDFAPVALCSKTGYAVSAGPGLPESVTTFAQFVAWCKANPKKASFASTSAGAASHFIGLMLSKAIGAELLHVPYKGGAPALQALMSGEVSVSINTIGEVMPQLASGRVRVLGTTTARRSRFLPDVPTLVENGLNAMDIETWVGVLVPARTPPDKVREMAGWFNAALQDADVRKGLSDAAMESVQSTPAGFAATIKSGIERWAPVVRASGFTAEE